MRIKPFVLLSIYSLLPLFCPMESWHCRAQNQPAGSWQKMSIPGATVSFEMPAPIKMEEKDKEGTVLYASQKGKMSFKVGIFKRNFEQDKAKGNKDDTVLQNFALNILAGSKLQFKQMGFDAKYTFVRDLKTPTGVGKQFQAQVGKAAVMDRFYINQQGLYWVEATTQNPADPEFNRFLDSFKP